MRRLPGAMLSLLHRAEWQPMPPGSFALQCHAYANGNEAAAELVRLLHAQFRREGLADVEVPYRINDGVKRTWFRVALEYLRTRRGWEVTVLMPPAGIPASTMYRIKRVPR